MKLPHLAVSAPLALAAAQLAPALSTVAPARRRLLPSLSGISRRTHLALTFDDGPDPVSTPAFVELLDVHRVSATFFLLGEHVRREQPLVAEMAAAGHELAVHGWDHRCVALQRPGALHEQLVRARDAIEDVTAEPVRWYRPPYGVLTTEALLAARSAGLHTVLWSAWGLDWSAGATPASIVRHVERAARPGGTVLLHDTDRTSARDSWRRTLPATQTLLERWRDTEVGPLREHW